MNNFVKLGPEENNSSQKFNLLVCAVWIFILLTAAIIFGFHSAPYADERHFYETVLEFGSNNLTTTISNYNEVTTPLTFILYSTWGHIFGFELWVLRLFSLMLSVCGIFLLLKLFEELQLSRLEKLVIIVSLFTNPYLVGTSILVYTDILAFVLMIWFFSSFVRGNNFVHIASALGVLTRQYFIIFPLSLIIIHLIKYIQLKKRESIYQVVYGLLSMLPFLLLVLLWGNIAPSAGIRKWTTENSVGLNPNALSIYIVFLLVYSGPVLIMKYKKIVNSKQKYWISVALISILFYYLFPVKASDVTINQINLETVGLAHKLIHTLLRTETLEHLILGLCFVINSIILTQAFLIYLRKSKTSLQANILFLISIFIFIFIMPFSYQVWEKYLLLILPAYQIILLKTY